MEKVLHLVLLSMVPVLGQVSVPDVEHVSVTSRTESELTLQWKIVGDYLNYSYVLKNSTEGEEKINATANATDVTHNVSSLSAGTYYSFTLYTVFNETRSSGYNFSNVTAPSNVNNITVIDQTETDITLEWDIVNGNKIYSYVLKNNSGEESEIINAPETGTKVNYTVHSLSPGTKYSFTLYTEFETVRSSGYNFSSATTPSNVYDIKVIDQTETDITLEWDIVNGTNNYSYVLKNSSGAESEIINAPETGTKVNYTVHSLSPGTKYSFTLYTVFETVRSSGYNFSSATIPSNVADVSVVNRGDSYFILQWMIVTNVDNNTYNYSLEYRNESWVKNITIIPGGNSTVKHPISGLIPATNYSFTLYTIFDDLKSKGFNFTNTTTLSEVTQVRVTDRSQTYLAVEWDKLNKDNIYNYILSQSDGEEAHISGDKHGDVIKYNLSNLSPGTEYKFTLFTVVKDNKSEGYNFKNVTTIDCSLFDWQVTNSSINAKVTGSTNVTATNSTGGEVKETVDKNHVNLQGLHPGANYTVLLWYYLESQMHLQCSQILTLDPNSVSSLHCEYFSGGYGLAVVWATSGIVNKVQVDVAGKSFNQSESRQEVKGLQVAQWYKVSATSFSNDRMSPTVSVNCQTDPAGVIAGVLVALLLIIIICAAIFLWRRKLKHAGGSKGHDEPKITNNTYKPIPMEKFPEHFRNMSRDQNRGFSEEYEDLCLVGVEQAKTTAEMPQNKSKNRFSNVLPYECSRVHLFINNEDDSDYINANYMPGYGEASRQYIATQGPLPSTVNDFWRMIWERRSQGIVMVTNCLERGTVKCEQYWPLDYTPCLYGYLLVTITSEDKAQSWTLREFAVTDKNTSETRTVRHFHFTAWPDHGVPLGTGELIRFRGLIRQHIESSPSSGPTVVHCSAGVGRTGTLIALDVLLQQLEREKAVSIAGFVQRMRLNRPLMVQTESQYVFLHQCIMDILQSKNIPQPEESIYENAIYENSDIIFANAVALKEYDKANQM
ncbi:receptor-type tyrosine-protein phosphatase H isoform X1 [Misgurnus anguillicaudatus]|uniref:receptor-type tyrosine-protein phosphatase H isoform X1 n=1 Tax=Misgurnus anguillicaudatus TaxID=75329 RepID=UPI003CCF4E41